jgi:hypothetical protein
MPEDAETPRTSPRTAPARADFGAPIDSFFERQPPAIRAILEELRRLIMQAAPDAQSSIKWGNPWFTIDGQMFCALTAHKAHVNLILYGEPQAFADPEGWLAGEGAGGRHLKLSEASEIPGESVARWLRTAAELARAKHGR